MGAPFEKQTGCKVKAKYAGSSDEMVNLMRSGGGGQYDMVSASGDASLRLIYGGDIAETNVKLVPAWKDFQTAFKSPPTNTVKGKHYGISLQFGPNILLYNTKKEKKPTSWCAIYNPKNKGKITIPDNPIQIADAALYLSKTQPALGIKDPYELDQKQLDAAVALLKKQKPLLKKYWVLGVRPDRPVQERRLDARRVLAVHALAAEGGQGSRRGREPEGGRHGLAGHLDAVGEGEASELRLQVVELHLRRRRCRRCRRMTYGETPVNKKACPFMNKLAKGSCAQYFGQRPDAYYRSIKFWKTPLADCGDARGKVCMSYTKWVQAWTQVKG